MLEQERATYTVAEVARIVGLGRTSTYEALRRGDIPSIRLGKRYLVPRAAIERMLSGEIAPVALTTEGGGDA